MEMEVTELDGKAIKIALRGRLDTAGVDQIETRFSARIVPGGRQAIVDLAEVSFIASMGLRMFITVARSVGKKAASWCCSRRRQWSTKSSPMPHWPTSFRSFSVRRMRSDNSTDNES